MHGINLHQPALVTRRILDSSVNKHALSLLCKFPTHKIRDKEPARGSTALENLTCGIAAGIGISPLSSTSEASQTENSFPFPGSP